MFNLGNNNIGYFIRFNNFLDSHTRSLPTPVPSLAHIRVPLTPAIVSLTSNSKLSSFTIDVGRWERWHVSDIIRIENVKLLSRFLGHSLVRLRLVCHQDRVACMLTSPRSWKWKLKQMETIHVNVSQQVLAGIYTIIIDWILVQWSWGNFSSTLWSRVITRKQSPPHPKKESK